MAESKTASNSLDGEWIDVHHDGSDHPGAR